MNTRLKGRMAELTLWALWWLVVGGAAAWLLAGSVGYWVIHGWLPKDASGWVQAIGSVAAIGVAIYVGERQNSHRMEADKQQSEEKAKKLLKIADLVVPRASKACDVRFGEPPAIILKRIASASDEDLRLLRQIDISELPTADITDAWLQLLGCVAAIDEDLAKLAGNMDRDGIERFGLEAAQETIQEKHAALEKAVRGYLE